MARILIADDERSICDAFAELFRREGHTPVIAASATQALARCGEDELPALAFVDVQMPGNENLALLRTLRDRHPDLPVVVMTAYGSMQTALQAIELGAFDYLGKPLEIGRIRDLVKRALHRPGTAAEIPGPPPASDAGENVLVGRSSSMQEIFKLMGLLTNNDFTVLITGESGVGKELVARGIHGHGRRRNEPFVAVNCAAIPENLLESELFGHEKGAFTGAGERRTGRCEAAGEGTLFLDEISEMPVALQGKLLRVLQERSFERIGNHRPIPLRARVVAATNRDLARPDPDRPFRSDLYHRLNLVTLNIPPLRQRKEDIAALATHFLAQANTELGKSLQGFEPETLTRLVSHAWPGNVRELGHTVRRSALTAHGPLLAPHDLALTSAPTAAPAAVDDANGIDDLTAAARQALRALVAESGEAPPGADAPFQTLVGDVETALVAEALALCAGNQVAAARLLGINRTTLRKRMDPSADGDKR